MSLTDETRTRIDRLVADCHKPREALLQAVEIVLADRRAVDDEAVAYLANRLKVSPGDVEDVCSFYPALSRKPVGRYVIRVCRSLPCALAGGEALIEHLARKLGVAPGETTADGRVTLQAAECLGLCDEAPAMLVNDTVHGRLTPERVDDILTSLKDE